MVTSKNASISDLKSILDIKHKPAYLWLYENNKSETVCFDDFIPNKPKPPSPPVGWTEWPLPNKYEGLSSPNFQGKYKPLNIFFDEIYKGTISQLDR